MIRFRRSFPASPFPVKGFPVLGPADSELVINDPLEYFGAALYAWWDVSDISTLFQDSAGTTPVALNNDPVGRINDKSGNGRLLTQGTAGNRPLYKDSLYGAPSVLFDKVNDSLTNTAAGIGANKEIFILFHVTRSTFPGSATTTDILMSSGIGGANNYDRDTYNGFVNTANNRAGQRRSTQTYVDGVAFATGGSIGTNAHSLVMSGITDGTASSDLGWYIGRNSDNAHFGNQALHQIVVVDRAVMPASVAETVAMHNLLLSQT
jgi:hypothetical protein